MPSPTARGLTASPAGTRSCRAVYAERRCWRGRAWSPTGDKESRPAASRDKRLVGFTAGEKEPTAAISYAIAERIRSPSDENGRRYTTRSMWRRLRQPFPISGTESIASPSLSKSTPRRAGGGRRLSPRCSRRGGTSKRRAGEPPDTCDLITSMQGDPRARRPRPRCARSGVIAGSEGPTWTVSPRSRPGSRRWFG